MGLIHFHKIDIQTFNGHNNILPLVGVSLVFVANTWCKTSYADL